MKRNKIVAGNWKMNCDREQALSLVTEIAGMLKDEYRGSAGVIVAPPFVHIGAVKSLLDKSVIEVAAQNCSQMESGAFTGEISAGMLKSVGASWVILGHSERRTLFGETDEMIRNKADTAIRNDLKVIFCCGESLEQREGGTHFETVKAQLASGLYGLEGIQTDNFVLAYEPVWAIGTGKTASPEQAQEMHAFIRSFMSELKGAEFAASLTILYGGSCNEKNAAELFAMEDVDGGLIGGASLKSRSFVSVIQAIR